MWLNLLADIAPNRAAPINPNGNPNWVLLIAVVVFIEKLLPYGEWTTRVVGGALVLLGLAVAVHPELAMTLHPPSMGM